MPNLLEIAYCSDFDIETISVGFYLILSSNVTVAATQSAPKLKGTSSTISSYITIAPTQSVTAGRQAVTLPPCYPIVTVHCVIFMLGVCGNIHT